jgi:hypothetical protein
MPASSTTNLSGLGGWLAGWLGFRFGFYGGLFCCGAVGKRFGLFVLWGGLRVWNALFGKGVGVNVLGCVVGERWGLLVELWVEDGS